MNVTEILTRFRQGELDRAQVRELLAGNVEQPTPVPEPLAVIGYSAMFPPDADAAQFWELLLQGYDAVTEVDPWRWAVAEFHDPDPQVPGRSISRWGGFLSRPDAFDADFFQIAPREADLMDPQARLFLQECYRALEHAGLRPGALAGRRCGVQAGVMLNDYLYRIERDSRYSRLPQVMPGNSHSLLPARIAHHLDLRGPVCTVDTACSSSLVAVHQACQALWSGEADLMLAGGVTLYLTEVPYVLMSAAGMLSPTGRCRAFAAAADGIVPGEGCGVVVLTSLRSALAAGDPVHGVIRASGTNHDGRTNGITAPSAWSQAELLRETYHRFGIDPATIDYVECHGTGTPLGDPIEITALNEVFRPAGRPPGSVPIGSVKTNIGHSSAAAGIAGLIKALGVVRTGEVPPSLHCAELNPRLNLQDGPFTVATEQLQLVEPARPRRAAVSSFGFSGTNAHIVVEQAPPREAQPDTGPCVVVLSGHRADRVPARARDLLSAVHDTGAGLSEIARTLAVHRDHFPHRVGWLVENLGQLREGLQRYLAGEPDPRRIQSTGESPPGLDAAQRHLLEQLYQQMATSGRAGADHLVAALRTYTQGQHVHWPRVLPPARPVSLPGYPFAEDSHWVGDTSPAPSPVAALPDTLSCYQAGWTAHPLPTAPAPEAPLLLLGEQPTLAQRWPGPVLPVTDPDAVPSVVTQLGAPAGSWLCVAATVDGSAGREPFVRLLSALREVLAATWRREVRLVLTTTDEVVAPALAGLVQSVTQENPRLGARAVLVDPATAAGAVVAELCTPGAEHGFLADARTATRRRLVWQPAVLRDPGPQPFRAGSVHLVTGGAGGIGLSLAEHLVRQRGARVVLCGRRDTAELPDPVRRRLATLGEAAEYVTADVADGAVMRRLVDATVRKHGALHGVLHAAGVIRDAFLVRKRTEQLDEVLLPKIDGVRALDAATAELRLELFVLFSSVASVVGNLGQSDYALANGYLDGYAAWRRGLVATGARSGRTLSINWPLWRDGGMTISAVEQQTLQEQVGMVPMANEDGWRALELLLSAEQQTPAVAVFCGERAAWERRGIAAGQLAATPARPLTEGPARERVRTLVAEVTGRPADELRMDVPLAALGIDSLMIKALMARMVGEFPDLGAEVFFTAPHLGAVADALADGSSPAESLPVSEQDRAPRQDWAHLDWAPGECEAEPIALIGLAGRYPGADTLAEFWRHLEAGTDLVAEMPADRTGGGGERGYFLSGAARFDPEFFGLTEHEARLMDPQERLFLQTAWHALEDAACLGERLDALAAADGRARNVGVFVGITSADYRLLGASGSAGDVPPAHYWSLPNRISYLLDLAGPSQPVDTACSSSLVALHMAAQSIRHGECVAALAGGVNLYLHTSRLAMLRRSGFLSEDGRCRSFGVGGHGFGPGEAVGAVVLKALGRALADGDPIRAVLLGSAVEHGGRGNAFTAPDPLAQARVLRRALKRSGVDPDTVTVLEAHGTGTELGDPVELAGLLAAYGGGREICSLGSVKSVVGHGESAAGITALTKVLLQLEHSMLVPTLHTELPHPAVAAASGRFRLQRTAEPWAALPAPEGTLPRRAGISSFGAGGVNAHVVVQQAPPPQPWPTDPSSNELVVLSAPSAAHLRRSATALASWCRDGDWSLAAIAHVLRSGRAEFPCRLATVARSRAELAERLAQYGAAGDGAPSPAGVLVNDLRVRRLDSDAFADGDPVSSFVRELWRAGHLDRVGRLWVQGLQVRWSQLTPPPAGTLPRLPGSTLLERPLWLDDPEPAMPKPADPAPADPAPADPVLRDLLGLIRQFVADTPFQPQTSQRLIDLGMESINVMNLRAEIEDRYGVTVPLEVLAGDLDLAGVARHLTRHREPAAAGPVTADRGCT